MSKRETRLEGSGEGGSGKLGGKAQTTEGTSGSKAQAGRDSRRGVRASGSLPLHASRLD